LCRANFFQPAPAYFDSGKTFILKVSFIAWTCGSFSFVMFQHQHRAEIPQYIPVAPSEFPKTYLDLFLCNFALLVFG
jgi:hypothetical protein